MAKFQHMLWGYELSYPDSWIHRTLGEIEGFALIPEALDMGYDGSNSGQILVKGEWNCARQSIEPIWNRHIGMLASWLGAHQVGSAEWHMAGATGIEAGIALPKHDNRRLWTGILEKNLTVLQFIVVHLKEEYKYFQASATKIISSLSFPSTIEGVHIGMDGIPVPPGYTPIPPQDIIDDIQDAEIWRAFDGESDIGGLQAFYLREAENAGWKISEYIPYPSPADSGFSRLKLEKDGKTATVGLMPFASENEGLNPGRIVFKLD